MYPACKLRNALLLGYVEFPQIPAIVNHIIPELTTKEMMQYHALFSGIHDLSGKYGFILFYCQSLFGKVLKKDCSFIINFLCRPVILEACPCRGTALFNSPGCQFFREKKASLSGFKFFIGFQCIKIFIFHGRPLIYHERWQRFPSSAHPVPHLYRDVCVPLQRLPLQDHTGL